MTGWNMPPGCSRIPGEEPWQCDVCCQGEDHCVCHECTVCGAVGDPKCYENKLAPRWPGNAKRHGQKLTKAQLVARQSMLVYRLEVKLREEQRALDQLKASADPFTDGEPGEAWSNLLQHQQDPFAIRTMYE